MSKKIALQIGGRRYNVDVDDEFEKFLKMQMFEDFNIDGNNDLKKLLHAYVKTNHKLFLQDREIKDILKKTEL
ncbi:MAG: hypothetical protein U9N33_01405 [Campylobacterota bacterium]|nr:hypothetical protein [Campylobacterota bacterium]